MFETTTQVCNSLLVKKMKNLKTSTECQVSPMNSCHFRNLFLRSQEKHNGVFLQIVVVFFRCFLLGRDNSTFLSFTQKDVDYGITIMFKGFWE